METQHSKKQVVLSAIRESEGNISFNGLEMNTGLSFMELSTIIGLLVKENRLLIRFNHSEENGHPYKSTSEYLYTRFMDLLFLHCKQERSVTFYASKLCITTKYLTVVVKAASSKTPRDLIREETIKRIEYLLCNTQTSIKEIAYALNFPNISFFGKYFKAQKGVSPKFYRKAYIEKKRDTLTMPLSATK